MGDVVDIEQFILVCQGQSWTIFEGFIIAVDSASKVAFIAFCEAHVHVHASKESFFIDRDVSTIKILYAALVVFDGFIGEAEFSIDDGNLIIDVRVKWVNFCSKVKVVHCQFAVLDCKVDASEAIEAFNFELFETFDFIRVIFFIFGLKNDVDNADGKFIMIDGAIEFVGALIVKAKVIVELIVAGVYDKDLVKKGNVFFYIRVVDGEKEKDEFEEVCGFFMEGFD